MTPAFLDILEWAADTDYDYAINVETDLTFIRPCFSSFVAGLMADADYMAFGYRRRIPAVCHLAGIPLAARRDAEVLSILGVAHVNLGFSPAQVFSTS